MKVYLASSTYHHPKSTCDHFHGVRAQGEIGTNAKQRHGATCRKEQHTNVIIPRRGVQIPDGAIGENDFHLGDLVDSRPELMREPPRATMQSQATQAGQRGNTHWSHAAVVQEMNVDISLCRSWTNRDGFRVCVLQEEKQASEQANAVQKQRKSRSDDQHERENEQNRKRKAQIRQHILSLVDTTMITKMR